jgi:hypothetical protein
MSIQYTFGLPFLYSIKIDEYYSWKDLRQEILEKHNLNLTDFKYFIYNDKICKINDDFIEIVNNEILYIVLDSIENNANINFFNNNFNMYNKYYGKINTKILEILYHYYLHNNNNDINNVIDINSIKKLEYKNLKSKTYTKCPLSNIEFDNESIIILLSCNHYYIEEYIMEWYEKYINNCPCCVFNFLIQS